MDSQVIESSQPIPPLQPPPPPHFPFYPNRSASPSSNPPSVSEMMGSEAVKFKDQLPEELKPEYERHLFECFTQGDPAACAEELIHEFQKRVAIPEPKDCELLYIAMIQNFLHFVNACAVHSKLESVTVKHDNKKQYTYIVLPKFFNLLPTA
ncbi:hypothetical protein AVEN_161528-1 [Araneus ventricosus]|uniref:Uncharacterized protein n=1 Tax=Araneus ventricosus TaxID=182803 RepID=A0A4Y2A1F0_ARAVE|nr:hypothetical protein AVEN_161528-1 [Araneus ventricosus]